MNEIIIAALETLIPIIVLAIGILIRNFLKEKGATQDQLLLLDEAYNLLTKAVISTNQIWVDALKEQENGLSAEAQEQARKSTIATFKQLLTSSITLAIETAYDSIDNWINLNLESAVGQVKMLKS